MSQEHVIGVSISAPNAQEGVDRIVHLEELGIGAAWLTSGGGGGEAMMLMAAAAALTDEIRLGTSIVQLWSRRPVTLAQQAQVIDSLAPGRFRLGVGTGHKAPMTSSFGVDFRAPIGHLREYLQILRALLHTGAVEYRRALVLRERISLFDGGHPYHGVRPPSRSLRDLRSLGRRGHKLGVPSLLSEGHRRTRPPQRRRVGRTPRSSADRPRPRVCY